MGRRASLTHSHAERGNEVDETLEVLGVKSGRIEEVFGFEAADIPVKAGRLDIMARDDAITAFSGQKSAIRKKGNALFGGKNSNAGTENSLC
jgi:hypothetical protein